MSRVECRTVEECTLGIDFFAESRMAFDSSPGREKLFLLSRSFLGDEDTERTRENLLNLVDQLVMEAGKGCRFLLLADAVKTLSTAFELSRVWQKAMNLERLILVEKNAFALVGAELDAAFKARDELKVLGLTEAAALLATAEVVTLN